MATNIFVGVKTGQGFDVPASIGAASADTDVELHIKSASITGKQDVLDALEKIARAVTAGTYPLIA
jgi:hypothetical protein